jgi:CO/xanthine dehydrogenase Mo-binding subunit
MAAIANAIYQATGKRLTDLPMTSENVVMAPQATELAEAAG